MNTNLRGGRRGRTVGHVEAHGDVELRRARRAGLERLRPGHQLEVRAHAEAAAHESGVASQVVLEPQMDPAVGLGGRRPLRDLEDRRVRFERAVEVSYEERPLRRLRPGPEGVQPQRISEARRFDQRRGPVPHHVR